MAMKVVRQARLELSGGSTPDQLRPPDLYLSEMAFSWRLQKVTHTPPSETIFFRTMARTEKTPTLRRNPPPPGQTPIYIL